MPGLICEYIWLDKWNSLRSKTRVLHDFNGESKIPMWNYDGSSTGQAEGSNSEIFLKPVKIVPDPFRREGAVLVLCDTWIIDKSNSNIDNVKYLPHPTNTREKALKIFNNEIVENEDPWYGLEQEFFFTKWWNDKNTPLGMKWSEDDKTWFSTSGESQSKSYCGIGPKYVFGRELSDRVLMNVLNTGITCTGLNFEVAPGQCEFQIFGKGIDAADSLILFRYILQRTAEYNDITIDFHPKPVEGDWNGSGCHANFSTNTIRNQESYEDICKYIELLKKNHKEHIENYGKDNKLRLTGEHETASWERFSYGVADRAASIRVPYQTFFEQKGYIEDRRPSSNCDPYIVTSYLVNTTVLSQVENAV